LLILSRIDSDIVSGEYPIRLSIRGNKISGLTTLMFSYSIKKLLPMYFDDRKIQLILFNQLFI